MFKDSLSHTELTYWLALYHMPGISLKLAYQLLKEFKTPSRFFRLSLPELRERKVPEKILKALKKLDWHKIESDLRWAEQEDRYILTSADYPKPLQEIYQPPLILYIRGQPETLFTPQLAVVGSRRASIQGKDCAQKFSYKLANQGLTITSGLALGIDAVSHLGALEAEGATIAVLGSGLNQIYPRVQLPLAKQILSAGGALISEFPLEAPPLRAHFPQRNRIISGLSLGVWVVEADLKSGSLITARYALEQGREVFATPGSIHHPLSKGCHLLIKQGAKLVEDTSDILQELPIKLTATPPKPAADPYLKLDFSPWDADHQRVMSCIEWEAVALDILVDKTGLSIDILTSILSSLEMRGLIRCTPSGPIKILSD